MSERPEPYRTDPDKRDAMPGLIAHPDAGDEPHYEYTFAGLARWHRVENRVSLLALALALGPGWTPARVSDVEWRIAPPPDPATVARWAAAIGADLQTMERLAADGRTHVPPDSEAAIQVAREVAAHRGMVVTIKSGGALDETYSLVPAALMDRLIATLASLDAAGGEGTRC
jgi:hypothetical protein